MFDLNEKGDQKEKSIITMKKYYRLFLIIISVISVISLLFYRHEYNRLRYVLEVLNFFGKPGEISVSSDCLGNTTYLVASGENVTFADTIPEWRRLHDDLYFYSAFWDTMPMGNDKEKVKAIAVGRKPESLNLGCRLWYENQELSSEGRVSHSALSMRIKIANLDKEKSSPYIVTCTPEVTFDNTPFAVSFYLNDNQINEIFLSLESHLQQDNNNMLLNSSVICVAPPINKKITPNEVVEFLSFHQLLGVTNFIVYYNALITPTSQLLLKENNLGYKITAIPWNFPYFSSESSITSLHWDCLMRAASIKTTAALHLNWNQFIVPRYHHTLSSVVNDFDQHISTAKFIVPILKFCLEYPEQESTISFKILKLLYEEDNKPNDDKEWLLERPHLIVQGGRTQQKVSRGIVAIHSYEQCNEIGSSLPLPPKKYDNSMTRFTQDLQKSKMYAVWKKHLLQESKTN